MAYRWSLEGPAFEFPSPFGIENRFLELRGYLLIALAIGVALVLALVGGDDAARPVVMLEKLPEKASLWPHVLGAVLMALLGGLNLLQASRQRRLLLTPGQPASLMPEVSHEATGASAGAAWLMRGMDEGVAAVPELSGPFLRWLRRLGGAHLAAAPVSLHDYMRVRLSRVALLSGLTLMLAVGALGALASSKPAALSLVALVVGVIGVAALTRHLVYPERAAPPPRVVAAVLVVGVLAAAPLAWFSGVLPGTSHWPRLGLPTAAAVMLILGLTFEALGLCAARAQTVAPQGAAVVGEGMAVSFGADPGRLLGEVDRELQRRWADGVPNRRYARLPPRIDLAADEGRFGATVLEESQPLTPPVARNAAQRRAAASATRAHWLLALEGLGLTASAAGGLLWLWLAYAHRIDAASSWALASVGLACLLVGGYALRIGHLLWSRVEVESTLLWLDFAGTYFRLPGAAPAPDASGRSPTQIPVGVEGLTLTAKLAKARSVFYAAAPHGAGSRTLLSLAGDPAAGVAWATFTQSLARSAAPAVAAETPAVRAAREHARARRESVPETTAAAGRPARFCSACGTPLLVGGRFCQHCGKELAAG